MAITRTQTVLEFKDRTVTGRTEESEGTELATFSPKDPGPSEIIRAYAFVMPIDVFEELGEPDQIVVTVEAGTIEEVEARA